MMESSFLESFWQLADGESSVRCKAVEDLLSVDALRVDESKEQVYTLKRLVRGLTSNRGSARHGFSLALTSFLRQTPSTSVVSSAAVLSCIQEHTKVTGSLRGQEERDCIFGLLFGLMALARSGRLQSSREVRSAACDVLYATAGKKSWLAELCYEVLCDVVQCCDSETIKEELLPLVLSKIPDAFTLSDLSPHQLDLCVTLVTKLETKDVKDSVVLSCVDRFLRTGDEASCAEMLDPLKLSCATFPRLHSVWQRLLYCILKSDMVEKLLVTLWNVVIENCLVQSTHERKHHCIVLFSELLEKLNTTRYNVILPKLLTPHFLNTLINNAASSDRYLHNTTQQCVDKFVNVLYSIDNESVKIEILCKLVASRFDQRIKNKKSKKVTELVTKLSYDGVIQYIEFLENQLTQNNTRPNEKTLKRDAIDALYAVSKTLRHNTTHNKAVTVKVMKLLFEVAFFKSSTLQSSAVRKHCCLRFVSIMSDLVSSEFAEYKRNVKKNNAVEYNATDNTIGDVLLYCINLEKEYCIALSQVEKRCIQANLSVLQKLGDNLNKYNATQKNIGRAVELLLTHITFQLFVSKLSDEVVLDCIDISEDLTTCVDSLIFSTTGNKKKQKQKAAQHIGDDLKVILDTMLYILAQPSVLFRNVVSHAFSAVASYIDSDTINVLLDALVTKASLSTEEHEEEEEEVEEDHTETDGATSTFDHQHDDQTNTTPMDESSDDDDDDDDDDESVECDTAELASALVDGAPSDSDESDSNSEMDEYDKALVKYFKQRIQHNTARSKAHRQQVERQNIHFKHRIVDLIEIYCNLKADNQCVVLVPCCVIVCAETLLNKGGVFSAGVVGLESKSLFDRLASLVKKVMKIKVQLGDLKVDLAATGGEMLVAFKDQSKDEESNVLQQRDEIEYTTMDSEEQICSLLKSSVFLATKASNTNVLKMCANVVTFALRLAQHNTTTTGESITYCIDTDVLQDIFKDAVVSCVCKKHSKIKTVFFEDIFEKNPQIGIYLVKQMSESSLVAKTSFQRCEALRLMSYVVKHCTVQHGTTEGDVDVLGYVVKALEGVLSDASVQPSEGQNGLLKTSRIRVVLQLCNDVARWLRKTDKDSSYATPEMVKFAEQVSTICENNGIKAKLNLFIKSQQNSQGAKDVAKTVDSKSKKKKRKNKVKNDKAQKKSKI